MNTRKSKIIPILARDLPSRVTVEGLDRAPHRAFLRQLSGALEKYAALVGSAFHGAVTHSGAPSKRTSRAR